jgi:hypothetical protein
MASIRRRGKTYTVTERQGGLGPLPRSRHEPTGISLMYVYSRRAPAQMLGRSPPLTPDCRHPM